MKRFIAKFLVLTMIMGTMIVPVSAEESVTTEAKIQYYLDQVMDIENKAEYVELLLLLRDIEDYEGFLTAYTAMFSSLLPGRSELIEAFESTVSSLGDFSKAYLPDDASVATLRTYLGLDDGVVSKEDYDNFYASLLSQKDRILTVIDKVDYATLDTGFVALDKLFEVLTIADELKEFEVGFIIVDSETGVMTIDYTLASLIILAMNYKYGEAIPDDVDMLAGFVLLVEFYNSALANDKEIVSNYLNQYGLIRMTAPTGDDGSSDDGSSDDGSSDDGSSDDGSSDDGSSDDGSSDDNNSTGASFVIQGLDMDAEIPAAGFIFTDLKGFDWAAIAIRQLYIAEILKGEGNGLFNPGGDITRAQIAAMFTRMFKADVTTVTVSTFSDILNTDWFASEVEAAYKAGYAIGVGNGMFAPLEDVTREQIATMLSRVLLENGVEAPSVEEYDEILSGFVDADQVSDWARQGAAMAVKYGLIQGKEIDGKRYFGFGDSATRAEVSVILYRAVVNKLVEAEVVVYQEDSVDN